MTSSTVSSESAPSSVSIAFGMTCSVATPKVWANRLWKDASMSAESQSRWPQFGHGASPAGSENSKFASAPHNTQRIGCPSGVRDEIIIVGCDCLFSGACHLQEVTAYYLKATYTQATCLQCPVVWRLFLPDGSTIVELFWEVAARQRFPNSRSETSIRGGGLGVAARLATQSGGRFAPGYWLKVDTPTAYRPIWFSLAPKRSELLTTSTLLTVIAAAAHMGFRWPVAARATPITL